MLGERHDLFWSWLPQLAILSQFCVQETQMCADTRRLEETNRSVLVTYTWAVGSELGELLHLKVLPAWISVSKYVM